MSDYDTLKDDYSYLIASDQKTKHAEAHCLMRYYNKPSDINEQRLVIIWNSRDGVTPHTVYIDNDEFSHCSRYDVYSPNHTPSIGDYVFVSHTMETAKESAESMLQTIKKRNVRYNEFLQMFGSESNYIEQKAKSLYGLGVSPYKIIATKEFIEAILSLRRIHKKTDLIEKQKKLYDSFYSLSLRINVLIDEKKKIEHEISIINQQIKELEIEEMQNKGLSNG